MNARMRATCNAHLDAIVRWTAPAHGTPWSAFRMSGYAGTAIGSALAVGLVSTSGTSPWMMAMLIPAAILTFLGLAMLTTIVTGHETLTYYHHQIAVLAVAAGLTWTAGRPIAPYLDAIALGIGAFLTCGRIGCLAAGCCHGRPHDWGIRYPGVGPRLFPIQLVESVWVAGVVALGAALVIRERAPGLGLASYVVLYGLGRFWLETARGDRRPHYAGLSQAQWLSVLLPLAVVLGELLHLLPFCAWHLLVTLAIALSASRAGGRTCPPARTRPLVETAT